MQDNTKSINVGIQEQTVGNILKPDINYSSILKSYGTDYQKNDFYWQVGKPGKVQGWILHLSVIAAQIPDLLQLILTLLIEERVSFKIPKDKMTARCILDGNLGYEQIGKIITIYPDTDSIALRLAKVLIELTGSYKGTFIPTDLLLGGIVYTRYGAFHPILRPGANGQTGKYIYSSTGNLIKDEYLIPFQLPVGVTWPFYELASPIVPKPKKNLQNIYKPISILKPDARGNVIKALYLKGLFRVGNCVIKIGKQNMLSDDFGRDIQDRLVWQRDLHRALHSIVPLPKILDLFTENGDVHLVMEYIKGRSLFEYIGEFNQGHKSWFQISVPERRRLLDWLQKILRIIDLFHQNGFVHRDIAPGNFLIDSRDEIILIDTELAYSLNKNAQNPPFELGTPGFMSPEQQAVSIPTIKEDVYGLGALMINVFVGLTPIKFNPGKKQALSRNLTFFINHGGTADLISSCLEKDPQSRPGILQIQAKLKLYMQELTAAAPVDNYSELISPLDLSALKNIIQDALNSLNKWPMPFSDGLWMSKTQKNNDGFNTAQKDFSPYAGLHCGMGGVLYLLAIANKLGFDIEIHRKAYDRGWKFIQREYIDRLPDFPPGFYSGAAGIALALSAGIDAGLLERNETNALKLNKCLDLPNEILGLADGVAGQGVAMLKSIKFMDNSRGNALFDQYVTRLLDSQEKDGSWNIKSVHSGKEHKMPVGLAYGASGIICFLLDYTSRIHNTRVRTAVEKAMACLLKKTHNLNDLFNQSAFYKLIGDIEETGDERNGILLCFIKAYERLQDPFLKEVTESALMQYPEFAINNNFSDDGGMAGLGELYLEAGRVFKNAEWTRRADRIAQAFIHTAYREDNGTCYWMMDESNKPVADLLVGNSGIIHFLIRCLNPNKLGYILLN